MEPLRTAILRHTTADGRHHFDWLLAGGKLVDAEAGEAHCWRCPALLTQLKLDEHMSVEALPMHRGLYLSLDAPRQLDQDRGWVEPVARGWAGEETQSAPSTCRKFVLRFENTEPLFVKLEGDRLTRVREC